MPAPRLVRGEDVPALHARLVFEETILNKPTTGIVLIRGKEYETVASRVHRFRETYTNWRLITKIIHRDELCVVMVAEVIAPEGVVMATGHAEEYRKASEINRTSALENCETSALGRALAAFGLGGTEFASADEVARAVSGAKGEAKGAISATGEAWKALDEDTQTFLRKVAAQVTGAMPDAAKALDILDMADLENERKAGLWHLLDSATRSALKRAKEAQTT